jgi:GDP-L-fucose synthase
MSEEALLTGPLEYTNEPYAVAKIAGLKMCESYNIQYNTNFIAVMPTNLYGPNDNFNLETSHVLPAMLRKIHLGKCLDTNDWNTIRKDLDIRPIEGISGKSPEKEISDIMRKYGISKENGRVRVELWGSGKPMREFLWSEEMADATVFVMESVNFGNVSNVGKGKEIRNTHINIGTGSEISIKNVADVIKKTVNFAGELWFNTDKPDGTMRKLCDVSKLNSLGWKSKIGIEEGLEQMYTWYTKYATEKIR